MFEDTKLDLKVGDKVRLTGPAWDGYGGVLKRGDVVTVTEVAENGKAWAGPARDILDSTGAIMSIYAIEKVEDAHPIHSLASVTEGIRELIGVLTSTGLDPDDARSIIMSNIETRLD